MEQAVTALIILTLVLFAALSLAQAWLSTQQGIAVSWQAMQERVGERARTSVVPISGTIASDVVDVTVKNDGHVRLADFAHWDVLLQYDTAAGRSVEWYPYVKASAPGPGQWTVMGIYQDAARAIPEAIEPGILDPGEEMVIQIKTAQPVKAGTTSIATIATPNGVSISIALTS